MGSDAGDSGLSSLVYQSTMFMSENILFHFLSNCKQIRISGFVPCHKEYRIHIAVRWVTDAKTEEKQLKLLPCRLEQNTKGDLVFFFPFFNQSNREITFQVVFSGITNRRISAGWQSAMGRELQLSYLALAFRTRVKKY